MFNGILIFAIPKCMVYPNGGIALCLRQILKNSWMFGNLDKKNLEIVVDAMEEKVRPVVGLAGFFACVRILKSEQSLLEDFKLVLIFMIGFR